MINTRAGGAFTGGGGGGGDIFGMSPQQLGGIGEGLGGLSSMFGRII